MPDPEEGVLVCSHVKTRTRPVLLVSREDGDWQFVCGGTDHVDLEDFEYVHYDHLLRSDPGLAALKSLPEDWAAERRDVHSAWRDRYIFESEMRKAVKSERYVVMMVLRNEMPVLGYTIGLSDYEHPELVLLGLNPERATEVLTTASELVVEGKRRPINTPVVDVFAEVEVFYVPAVNLDPTGVLRYAFEHAGGALQMLQLVWPDNSLSYPWDPSASSELRRLQPLLGPPPRKPYA